METPVDAMDLEITVMSKINDAFKSLSDEEAKKRVLYWTNLKFGQKNESAGTPVPTFNQPTSFDPLQPANVLPSIAKLDAEGNFEMIVDDLKAKSQNDAAVRLAVMAIWAYKKLKAADMSSRKDLLPILKHYRLYDGNTRASISKYRGIRRSGDTGDILSLDAFAQKEAEGFLKEIQDTSIEGKWTPRAQKYTRKKEKVTEEDPK